jgi:hypothetical protein
MGREITARRAERDQPQVSIENLTKPGAKITLSTCGVDHGSVIIRLTSTPSTDSGKAIYTLQIIAGKSTPSVVEEAALLKEVTVAMQNDGMSPTRIAAINLEVREPDVSKQLSMAAYESKEWRDAKASDYGVIVIKLLNSIRAYDAFDHLFAQYGLSVEVTHAEYISTVRPEQLGLKRNGLSGLPSSATLDMVLRRKVPQ